MSQASAWRKCSSCKKDILINQIYYVCSVSTCRQKKTDYIFCDLECWDRHIPVERHRGDTASAIEKRAPRVAEPEQGEPMERKRIIAPSLSTTSTSSSNNVDEEVLVVVSKVKKYISDRSGMNTSASVMDALTARVRLLCDQAIAEARNDGRKTVMDRDFK
jgi:hypothetical protein